MAPARDGTAERRTVPVPPRTCASGDTVTSSPLVAMTTKGSAMIGTSPAARTVTANVPEPDAVPSETVRATDLRVPPSPRSE